VYEGGNGQVGLLEPVRRTLKDRWAVVWSQGQRGLTAAEFQIPAGTTEQEFVDRMWSAAEQTQNQKTEQLHAERAYSLVKKGSTPVLS
jgi:hypothetical protein